jgi:hypothetical protein
VSERLDLESIAEIIGSYCPAHETGVDPRMIAEAVLDEILPEVERLRTELAKSEAFVEHFRQLHRDWKSAFEGAKAEADRLTVELARRDQQITAVRALADRLDTPTNWDRRSNRQLSKALRAAVDGTA